MKSILINIGDELLIGQTINTNAAWVGKYFYQNGIDVIKTYTISDDEQEILNTLHLAKTEADLIIITGGLGPTKDDITKKTLCKYFNSELIINEEVLDRVTQFFKSKYPERKLLQINKDQALVPKNSFVLHNTRGTASGMLFYEDNTYYVSLPGVPYEMKGLIEDELMPYLASKVENKMIHHKQTIMFYGIGESFLADKIKKWEESLIEENIKIAYLPTLSIVKLRLTKTINANQIEDVKSLFDQKVLELKELVGDYIFNEEEIGLENLIQNLSIQNKFTVSTAESCTGGSISALLTSIPGSSAYFEGAIVSYSNNIKTNVLDVDNDSLKAYGAVSKQVVEQMALGAKNELDTMFSIATSGIAGPDGGTDDKPVGTVWISIATPYNVISKKFHFRGGRTLVIKRTVQAALMMLVKEMKNYINDNY